MAFKEWRCAASLTPALSRKEREKEAFPSPRYRITLKR